MTFSLLTLIPPQEWLDRKSTGDVTPGWTGYLKRKSNSAGFISLFISKIWVHNKCRRTLKYIFSTNLISFPLDYIQTWPQGSRGLIQSELVRKTNHAEDESGPAFPPGRRAERCTWACHTRTGLWWCTGRRRRWCCQLGWTPAASEPRLARPSEPLSGRPHWTPGKSQHQAEHWLSIWHQKVTPLSNNSLETRAWLINLFVDIWGRYWPELKIGHRPVSDFHLWCEGYDIIYLICICIVQLIPVCPWKPLIVIYSKVTLTGIHTNTHECVLFLFLFLFSQVSVESLTA